MKLRENTQKERRRFKFEIVLLFLIGILISFSSNSQCDEPDYEIITTTGECDHRGTWDNDDDWWSFTLQVLPDGTWYSTDNQDVGSSSSGDIDERTVHYNDYMTSITFTVFLGGDPDCAQEVTIMAPPPCGPGECFFDLVENEPIIVVGECQNQNTLSPDDDTYTIAVKVGNVGYPWHAINKETEEEYISETGGFNNQIGPFPANGEDWILRIQLDGFFDCRIDFYIVAPESCSDDVCNCAISDPYIDVEYIGNCTYQFVYAADSWCQGDPSVTNVAWDWGEGGPVEVTNSGYNTHTFAPGDSYTVILTIIVTNTLLECSNMISDPVEIDLTNGCQSPPDFGSGADDGGKKNMQISSEEDLSALSLFPNPSNGQVNIDINLNKEEFRTLKVFNVQGALVAELSQEYMEFGDKIIWDARAKLETGIYLIVLQTNNSTISKTMVLH